MTKNLTLNEAVLEEIYLLGVKGYTWEDAAETLGVPYAQATTLEAYLHFRSHLRCQAFDTLQPIEALKADVAALANYWLEVNPDAQPEQLGVLEALYTRWRSGHAQADYLSRKAIKEALTEKPSVTLLVLWHRLITRASQPEHITYLRNLRRKISLPRLSQASPPAAATPRHSAPPPAMAGNRPPAASQAPPAKPAKPAPATQRFEAMMGMKAH